METTTPEPFAFTEAEQNSGPEHAAWKFLRLSDEYESAFRRVSKMPNDQNALNAILDFLVSPSAADIASAQDTICRQKFGLAAWLNPELEQLPALKNKGDSWFFPLKCPVQENPRRKDVGIEPPELLATPGVLEYPLLLVEETPFGYGRIRRIGRDAGYSSRPICVAIDCSVPPDAQISTLERLAHMHREYWMDNGMQTTHDIDVVIDEADADGDTAFSSMRFKRAHALGLTNTSTAHLWRVVCIDTLGAIGNQIIECRRKLQATYREIRDSKIFETDWPARFPHRIQPAPNGNKAPDESSMLKALVKLAEATKPKDPKDKPPTIANIVEKIGLYPKGIAHPRWAEHFQGEILDQHLPLAQKLKNELYRWLVYLEITYTTR